MGNFRDRHYLRLLLRISYLWFCRKDNSGEWVQKSYERISGGYDAAWTHHMRDLTSQLIDKMELQEGNTAIDLTCGTGFATRLIAEKTKSRVVGVDRCEGMLLEAQNQYGNICEFVQADILDYLKTIPDNSIDIITCCWGLGYSKPWAVLRQARRILKAGGKIGIVDNTIFSLREILYCSFQAFAETPEKLINLMRFRFLTGKRQMGLLFKILGMKPLYLAKGERAYKVATGKEAIARLQATGAAAGFEYAAQPEDEEEIFGRFAEIIEEKYKKADGITITHRYLLGIAVK